MILLYIETAQNQEYNNKVKKVERKEKIYNGI